MNRIDFQSDPLVIWERFFDYSGDVAFDVGANGGMVSAILAENFKKVVAFEPHPDSFEALSELGPPIVPQRLALSDHSGEVTLARAEHTERMGEYVTGDSLQVTWGRHTAADVVPCSTLSAQAEIHGIPDFVKIDTEGHEVQVVWGGLYVFNEHKPDLLIEVHAEENEDKLRSLLLDYHLERIDHPGYREDSYERANHFFLVSRG